MATEIELEIGDLLLKGDTASEVAVHFLLDIHNSHNLWDDKIAILNFSLAAGCHKQILGILSTWSKDEEDRFPWKILIKVLSQHIEDPDLEIIGAIIKGSRAQQQLDDLGLFPELHKLHAQFKESREQLIPKMTKKHNEAVKKLYAKLNFLKTQRLYPEQNKIYLKLLSIEPNNQELIEQFKEFKLNWSKEIINQYQLKKDTPAEEVSFEKNDSEEAFYKNLLEEFKKNNDPHMVYDFAISLHLIDASKYAIEWIDSQEPSESTEWLKAELLYHTGQFINCLHHLEQLQIKYKKNPDTDFSVVYLKALCLHKLKKNHEAISLLKSLINIKGNFRASNILLRDWMSEDQI